jgi:hypothetical protein
MVIVDRTHQAAEIATELTEKRQQREKLRGARRAQQTGTQAAAAAAGKQAAPARATKKPPSSSSAAMSAGAAAFTPAAGAAPAAAGKPAAKVANDVAGDPPQFFSKAEKRRDAQARLGKFAKPGATSTFVTVNKVDTGDDLLSGTGVVDKGDYKPKKGKKKKK